MLIWCSILTSITKKTQTNGLSNLTDICFNNSLTERYLYDANETRVVIFNKIKHQNSRKQVKWHIGQEKVGESNGYVHLNGFCYSLFKDRQSLTCFILADCGFHKSGLHPKPTRHLHKIVVLSKSPFGCKLWWK